MLSRAPKEREQEQESLNDTNTLLVPALLLLPPTTGFFFFLLLLLLLLLVLTLRPAFQFSPLSLHQTSSRPAYVKFTLCEDDGVFFLSTFKALFMPDWSRPRAFANAFSDS